MKNLTIILSLLFLFGCESSSNGPTYTECECTEIFKLGSRILDSEKLHIPSLFNDPEELKLTNINTCFNDYIQEKRSDGSIGLVNNIKPCFKEAFQNGINYEDKIKRAGMCDCGVSLISPQIKNISDIIHNAIDNEVSDMNNTRLIDSTKIDIGTHNFSNSSFDIFNNKIVVLDSIYSYDAIRYIDNYLCVYSKENLLYMISLLGDKIKLTNFKIETIDGLNDSKEFDLKETLLYNEYYEFAFVEAGVAMNSVEYSLRKFNTKRDQAIQETIQSFGGKYVGRGVIRKRTSRQVWKKGASFEANFKAFGPNAFTTDDDYEIIPFHTVFMKTAYNYGKSIWDIYAKENIKKDSIKNIREYQDSISRADRYQSELKLKKLIELHQDKIESDLDQYVRNNPQIKDNAKELILESIDNGIIQIESIIDILSEKKKISKRHIKKLIKDNKRKK
tara:strand:+ start:216 stop:1556 length:1341 start_codon:yes stop_codon:yes gene_type:complete